MTIAASHAAQDAGRTPMQPPVPSARIDLRIAPVFSINFIRGETFSLSTRRWLMAILLGYLAIHAALFLAFTGTAVSAHLQGQALRRTVQGAAPSVEAISGIEQEMAMLEERAKDNLTRLAAVAAEQRQRFPVAGKLAALTKTIPPRTWITGLSGAREGRTLTVRAAYLVDAQTPYALPTKGWMDALQADPVFGRGLKQLKLATSSRKTQGTAELVIFELVADWQPLKDHE